MSEYVFRYADGYGWKPGAYEQENNIDHYGTLHEEIVRCRDCVHYTDDEMEYYHYCNRWCEQVEPDGYCAWACRKEQ